MRQPLHCRSFDFPRTLTLWSVVRWACPHGALPAVSVWGLWSLRLATVARYPRSPLARDRLRSLAGFARRGFAPSFRDSVFAPLCADAVNQPREQRWRCQDFLTGVRGYAPWVAGGDREQKPPAPATVHAESSRSGGAGVGCLSGDGRWRSAIPYRSGCGRFGGDAHAHHHHGEQGQRHPAFVRPALGPSSRSAPHANHRASWRARRLTNRPPTVPAEVALDHDGPECLKRCGVRRTVLA